MELDDDFLGDKFLMLSFLILFGLSFGFCFCCYAVFCCCCPAIATAPLIAFGLCLTNRKDKSHPLHQDMIDYNSINQLNNMRDVETDAYWLAPLADARIVEIDVIDEVNGNWTKQRMSQRSSVVSTQNPSSEVTTSYEPIPKPSYKDVWAGVLFMLNVLVVMGMAVKICYSIVHDNEASYDDQNVNDDVGFTVHHLYNAMLALMKSTVLFSMIAFTFSFIFMLILFYCSPTVIETVIHCSIAAWIGFGITAYVFSSKLFGLFLSIFIASSLYGYLTSIRSRIPFSSSLISTACVGIREHQNKLLFIATVLLLFQVSWIFCWVTAMYAVYIWCDSETNEVKYSIYIIMILSLFWGIKVIYKVGEATIAGTIGCWWFQPYREAVVRGSLFRAVTTSFGSICFASLPIISSFCMRTYANLSLCYVSAYGRSFLDSFSRVRSLVQSRGWTPIIGDNLVAATLSIGVCSLCGIMTLMALYSTAIFSPSLARAKLYSPTYIIVFLGVLIGFALGRTVTSLIESGVGMVFICLAEDPYCLQFNHPEEFLSLSSAWLQMGWPDILRSYGTASTSTVSSSSNLRMDTYGFPQENHSSNMDPTTNYNYTPSYRGVDVTAEEYKFTDRGYDLYSSNQPTAPPFQPTAPPMPFEYTHDYD